MRKFLFGIILLAAVQSAQAAELRVLSSGGTLGPAKAFAAEFTKQTGTTITFDTGPAAEVQHKVETGEAIDVILASASTLDRLDRSGHLKPGTKKSFVRTGLGVGARAGAAKPDISTVDKFRAVMLGAKSVIVRIDPPVPPRPDSRLILDIFERIGIAGPMAAKTRVQTEGRIGAPVASGEIEFAVQNTTQIMQEGLEFVGPLPEELQNYYVYSAGVGAKSIDQKAAQDFIAYLTRAEAMARWQAVGLEPVKN